MTVALSIKVYDGIVLATDSAATYTGTHRATGQSKTINIYNNANKIFNLHRGLPVGGMVWGTGSIGTASMERLAKDLRAQFEGREGNRGWEIDPDGYAVKDIAEQTRDFLYNQHYRVYYRKQRDPPDFGFLVVGYSSQQGLAEEWLIKVEDGKCTGPTAVRPIDRCGWDTYVMREPIHRLLFGVSEDMEKVLRQCFQIAEADIGPSLQIMKEALGAPLVWPAMPVKDVIDLANFLVRMTCQFYRFYPGERFVGGPVEIAAITKHEGFKWIKRKHYYSAALNPAREVRHEAPAKTRLQKRRRQKAKVRSR